jgi:hypothetical protein
MDNELIREDLKRRSIFPPESGQAAPRPSKRMATNDYDRDYPSAVKGDIPVNPDFSKETLYARTVQPAFRQDYMDAGKQFWPINRLVEAISEHPEEVSPGVYSVRLFADLFIRPTRSAHPDADGWIDEASLVARTVISPVFEGRAVKLKAPELEDAYYLKYFTWNIYWHSVSDILVDVGPPLEPTSDAFLTLPTSGVMTPGARSPLRVPFALRRGSENDTVIIKHGTPIATIRIREYL